MLDAQYCIYCTEKKDKLFSHMRGVKRIYKDYSGAEWSGNRCPECYAAYKVEYDAKRRLKKGMRILGTTDTCAQCGEQFEVVSGSNKKCLSCRKNTSK